MYNINKKFNIALISLFFLLVLPVKKASSTLLQPSIKDEIKKRAESSGSEAGFNIDQGLGDVVGLVIQAFLGLLGIIFLILIIFAGYNWMTAGGEEEKVRKAKSTISRAVIGLIIIVAAYAITYFVFAYLPGATGSTGY